MMYFILYIMSVSKQVELPRKINDVILDNEEDSYEEDSYDESDNEEKVSNIDSSQITLNINGNLKTKLKIPKTNYILEPEQSNKIYRLYILNNKSGKPLFVDKITNENGIFEKKMYVEVFKTLWTDKSIITMLDNYEKHITFKESIYCLLMVKDGHTQNKYHEYMPYHNILFELEADKDLNQFINYYNMTTNPMYKPFYNGPTNLSEKSQKAFIHARDENRFDYWLHCALKSHELFGPFYHLVSFEYQYNIDGKLLDVCINKKISIEFHEIGKAHLDNETDTYKKQLVIKNNMLPLTFRMDDYEGDNHILELKSFLDELVNYLFGTIFLISPDENNEDVIDNIKQLREQFSINRFIILMKKDIKSLKKNLKELNKNEHVRIQLKDEIKALEARTSADELEKFKLIFKWKHESQTNKITDKVINLDEVIKELQNNNLNLKQELIKKYSNKIKLDNNIHMINWDFMSDIINDHSRGTIQKNLFAYLKTVQSSYEMITDKYITPYLCKINSVNYDYHNMMKIVYETSKEREIDMLKKNNKISKLTIIELKKKIKEVITAGENMKKNFKNKKILETKPIQNFYEKFDKLNTYYKKTKHDANKKSDETDYEPNVKNIGAQIFDIEGFDIIYTGDYNDSISKDLYFSKCSQYKVPKQSMFDFEMLLAGTTNRHILRKIKIKVDGEVIAKIDEEDEDDDDEPLTDDEPLNNETKSSSDSDLE